MKSRPQHRNGNFEIPGTVMVTHMSHMSITDVTDMGVSHPNNSGPKTVAPTNNVHAN